MIIALSVILATLLIAVALHFYLVILWRVLNWPNRAALSFIVGMLLWLFLSILITVTSIYCVITLLPYGKSVALCGFVPVFVGISATVFIDLKLWRQISELMSARKAKVKTSVKQLIAMVSVVGACTVAMSFGSRYLNMLFVSTQTFAGREAIVAGKFDDARVAFESIAKDDSSANISLAAIYAGGLGVPMDEKRAMELGLLGMKMADAEYDAYTQCESLVGEDATILRLIALELTYFESNRAGEWDLKAKEHGYIAEKCSDVDHVW